MEIESSRSDSEQSVRISPGSMKAFALVAVMVMLLSGLAGLPSLWVKEDLDTQSPSYGQEELGTAIRADPPQNPLVHRGVIMSTPSPDTTTSITPLYTSQSGAVVPSDLATENVTRAVKEKASSLGGDPVELYRFVRNSVIYDPYWGSMRGADETLMQLAGNDLDQSILLSTMLRTSGYGTRYVMGTVTAPGADVMSWTSSPDEATALRMLLENGVPASLSSGIFTFQHVWLEANLDGSWVTLDPSYSTNTLNAGPDWKTILGYDDAMWSNALSKSFTEDGNKITVTGGSGLSNIVRSSINESMLALSDMTSDSTLRPLIDLWEVDPFAGGSLPTDLPFTVNNVISEFSTVPDSLCHKAVLELDGTQVEVRLSDWAGKRLTLTYYGAGPEDEDRLEALAAMEDLYTDGIMLRGALTLDGEIQVLSQSVEYGTEQALNLTAVTPWGDRDPLSTNVIAGSTLAVLYDAGRTTTGHLMRSSQTAVSLVQYGLYFNLTKEVTEGEFMKMHGEVFFMELDEFIRLNAGATGVRTIRQPSFLAVGRNMTRLWDDWMMSNGLYFDILRDSVNIYAADGQGDLEKAFRSTIGCQAASLESQTINRFSGDQRAVSTPDVILSAVEQGIPLVVATSESDLAGLTAPPSLLAGAQNAVASGLTVIIPQQAVPMGGDLAGARLWVYVVTDPTTGASGYYDQLGRRGAVWDGTVGGPVAPLFPLMNIYNTAAYGDPREQAAKELAASQLQAQGITNEKGEVQYGNTIWNWGIVNGAIPVISEFGPDFVNLAKSGGNLLISSGAGKSGLNIGIAGTWTFQEGVKGLGNAGVVWYGGQLINAWTITTETVTLWRGDPEKGKAGDPTKAVIALGTGVTSTWLGVGGATYLTGATVAGGPAVILAVEVAWAANNVKQAAFEGVDLWRAKQNQWQAEREAENMEYRVINKRYEKVTDLYDHFKILKELYDEAGEKGDTWAQKYYKEKMRETLNEMNRINFGGGPGGDHPDDKVDVASAFLRTNDFFTTMIRKAHNKGFSEVESLEDLRNIVGARPVLDGTPSTDASLMAWSVHFSSLLSPVTDYPDVVNDQIARSPDVLIYGHGFSQEVQAMLTTFNEPAQIIDEDFDPDWAASIPLLIIPSGGLFGQESSVLLREKFTRYTELGGTLLCMGQQTGSEFGVLPLSPEGQGWAQDQSCFRAAVYLDTFTPVHTSQTAMYPDASVDGYFTSIPADSTVMLRRNINNQPCMILYPVGTNGGRVIATTLYTDYAYAHNAHAETELLFFRDAVAWATHHAPKEVVSQGGASDTITVKLDNPTSTNAAVVGIGLVDPMHELMDTYSYDQQVPAAGTAELQFPRPTLDEVGVYSLDVALFAEDGTVLDTVYDHTRFSISRFVESPGGFAVEGKEITFAISTPRQVVVQHTMVPFTFHFWNIGDTEETVTAKYYWRHTSGSNAEREVTVPANGNTSFTVVHESSDYRWWFETTQLDVYGSDGSHLGKALKSLRFVEPFVEVEATVGGDKFLPSDSGTVEVSFKNLAEDSYPISGKVKVVDPDGKTVTTADISEFELDGMGTVSKSAGFTLPAQLASGVYSVQVDALSGTGLVGFGSDTFNVPELQVKVDLDLPAVIEPNTTPDITAHLTNLGAVGITTGTFNLALHLPNGTEIWNTTRSLTLGVGETTQESYSVPFGDLQLGTYTFRFTAVSTAPVESNFTAKMTLPCLPDAQLVRDKPAYRAGDEMTVSYTLTNPGIFHLAMDLSFSVPELGAVASGSVDLMPGDTHSDDISGIVIPVEFMAGEHFIVLEQTMGNTVTEYGDFYVLGPQMIFNGEPAGPLGPSDVVGISARNVGGSSGEFTVLGTITNADGRELGTVSSTETLGIGDSTDLGLTLPANAVSGTYMIELTGSTNVPGGVRNGDFLGGTTGWEEVYSRNGSLETGPAFGRDTALLVYSDSDPGADAGAYLEQEISGPELEALGDVSVDVYPNATNITGNTELLIYAYAYTSAGTPITAGPSGGSHLVIRFYQTTSWGGQGFAEHTDGVEVDRWNTIRFSLKDDISGNLRTGYTWEDVGRVRLQLGCTLIGNGKVRGAFDRLLMYRPDTVQQHMFIKVDGLQADVGADLTRPGAKPGDIVTVDVGVTNTGSTDIDGTVNVMAQTIEALLEGRVTDSGSGDPVSGARVSILTSAGRTVETRTDGDGWYRLEGLPSGTGLTQQLTVRRMDYNVHTSTHELEPGLQLKDIELDPSVFGDISGTVYTDQELDPVYHEQTTQAVSGARIDLAPVDIAGNDAAPVTIYSNVDGSYSLSHLPVGDYSMDVLCPGYGSWSGQVTIKEGSNSVDVPLDRDPFTEPGIIGQVVDGSGNPVVGAKVVKDSDGSSAYTDTEGTYGFELDADGNVDLTVHAQGFAIKQLSVPVSGLTHANITLTAIDIYTFTGTTYNNTIGDPVPGAVVTLTPSSVSAAYAVTMNVAAGWDGVFRITHVPEGTYDLTITAPRSAGITDSVSVTGGTTDFTYNADLNLGTAWAQEVEPNGDRASATAVDFNIDITGNESTQWDLDYFEVTMDGPGAIRVSLQNYAYTAGWSYLQVQNETGADLGKKYIYNANEEHTGYVNAAGTYYVVLYSESASSTNPYTVRLTTVPSVDPHEPNGDMGSAKELTLDTWYHGTELAPGPSTNAVNWDHDYFTLDLPAPGRLTVNLEDFTFVAGWSFVKLFNATGVQVGVTYIYEVPFETTYNFQTEGTYYLEVYAENTLQVTPYSIHVGLTPVSDPAESNTQFANARPIEANREITGYWWHEDHTTNPGEVRWDTDNYVLEMPHPGRISLRLKTPEFTNGWTKMAVYNATAVQVGGTKWIYNYQETLTVNVNSAGTYYIHLYSDSTRSVLPYRLRVTTSYVVDNDEQNDIAGQAVPLELDTPHYSWEWRMSASQPHAITYDTDYFSVELDRPGVLRVNVYGATIVNGWTRFTVYDGDRGYELANKWMYAPEESLNVHLNRPGKFLIRFYSDNTASVKPYMIVLSQSNREDLNEPNDMIENAAPIALEQKVRGFLWRETDIYPTQVTHDHDNFALTVPDRGTMTLSLSGLGNPGGWVWIAVLDSGGNTVNSAWAYDDSFSMEVKMPAAGRYVISVQAHHPVTHQTYTLTTTFVDPEGNRVGDYEEPLGWVDAVNAGSEDLTVSAGGTGSVSVDLSGLAVVGKLRLRSELLNSAGWPIGSNTMAAVHQSSDLALDMEVYPAVAEIGETVTVRGRALFGPDAPSTVRLTLSSSETVMGAWDLNGITGPSTFSYSFIPQTNGVLKLEGGGVSITETVMVRSGFPRIDVQRISDQLVESEDSPLALKVTNQDKAAVGLDMSCQQSSAGLDINSGSSAIVLFPVTILDDTELVLVSRSGSFDRTETFQTGLSINPHVVVPEPFAVPWDSAAIPVQVDNTGKRPASFDLQVTAGSDSVTIPVFLLPGALVNISVPLSLKEGSHELTAVTPVRTQSIDVEVVRSDLYFQLETRQSTERNITLGINVTNLRTWEFEGGVHVDAGFLNDTLSVMVPPKGNTTVSVQVSVPQVEARTYDIQVSAVGASGEQSPQTFSIDVVEPRFVGALSDFPDPVELGQAVDFAVKVSNTGVVGGMAEVNVSITGIYEGYGRVWVNAGETVDVPFSFDMPTDLEDGEYKMGFLVGGEWTWSTFKLNGVRLDVKLTLDKEAYVENDTVTLSTEMTNPLLIELELRVLVQLGKQQLQEEVTIPAGETRTVSSELTARLQDGKLFIGIYSSDGRSLYINSRFLTPDTKTLYNIDVKLDRQELNAGGSANLTVSAEPDTRARADIYPPLSIARSEFIDEVDHAAFMKAYEESGQATLKITVPDIIPSGTYSLDLGFGEGSFQYQFDVHGTDIVVKDTQFNRAEYDPVDTVNLSVVVESSHDIEAIMETTVLDPEGNEVGATIKQVDLVKGENSLWVLVPFTTSQGGIHRAELRFRGLSVAGKVRADGDTSAVELTAASMGFDVVGPTITGLAADMMLIQPSDTINLTVRFRDAEGSNLTILVDGSPHPDHTSVAIGAADQSYTASLEGPWQSGRVLLTTRFESGGDVVAKRSIGITVSETDVEEDNAAPASLSMTMDPTTISVGTTVNFGASANDPEGDRLGFQWDFGDGKKGYGQKVEHAFQEAGNYTITLTVNDFNGHTPSIVKTISVGDNLAPEGLDMDIAGSRVVGEELTFTGTAVDPDGDTLTFDWDFGDDEMDTGEQVVHTYASTGNFTVTLTVSDTAGHQLSVNRTITIDDAAENSPPENLAVTIPDQIVAGEPVTFKASGVDPDGDTLIFSWIFGDGGSDTGDEVTHTYEEEGQYKLTLNVTDGYHDITSSRLITVEAPDEGDGGGGDESGLPAMLILLILGVAILAIVILLIVIRRRKEADRGDDGDGSKGEDAKETGDGSDGAGISDGSDGSDGADGAEEIVIPPGTPPAPEDGGVVVANSLAMPEWSPVVEEGKSKWDVPEPPDTGENEAETPEALEEEMGGDMDEDLEEDTQEDEEDEEFILEEESGKEPPWEEPPEGEEDLPDDRDERTEKESQKAPQKGSKKEKGGKGERKTEKEDVPEEDEDDFIF